MLPTATGLGVSSDPPGHNTPVHRGRLERPSLKLRGGNKTKVAHPCWAIITHYKWLPGARQSARSLAVGQGAGRMGQGFGVWPFLCCLPPRLAVTSCSVSRAIPQD